MGLFSKMFEEKADWIDRLLIWGKKNSVFPSLETRDTLLNKKEISLSDSIEYSNYTITELPDEICKLRNLKKLSLTHLAECGSLVKLPNCIDNLESLIELDISRNDITELPKEIGNLKNLKVLNLNGNSIVKLPKEIEKLTNLEYISLYGNPVEYNKQMTSSQIQWLESLKGNGCNVEEVNFEMLHSHETFVKVYAKKNNMTSEEVWSINSLTIYVQTQIEKYPELLYGTATERWEDFEVYNSDGTLNSELTDMLNENDPFSDEDEDGFVCNHMIKSNNHIKTQSKIKFDSKSFNKHAIKFLYHMTHYKNVENILENGLLSHNNKFVNEHIDNADVNDRRNKQEPIFNQNIQDYVPFYFNPKNPMLYVNQEKQDDIVILAFSRDLLLQDKTLFTDGNAAVKNTRFFNDLDDLEELHWDCINARYWHDFEDGKREVMAEVLVPNKVGIEHLEKIFCYDDATKGFILDIDDDLDVEIKASLYF